MERSVIEDGGVKVAVIACVESSIPFHYIEASLLRSLRVFARIITFFFIYPFLRKVSHETKNEHVK
jgi:hypothetical protein